jgi:hypothetical protein
MPEENNINFKELKIKDTRESNNSNNFGETKNFI